jgi:LemA protein
MKRILKPAVTVFFVLLLTGCGYNRMVSMDEMAKAAWSQVENQYQRRADLIPNLVETVKGYASHEEETLTAVIEARAKATSINVNPGDAASMQEFLAAQGELDSALSRLMVTVEAYPDLKADSLFTDLLHQLEGTENRIAVARMDYNNVVQGYNSLIRRFPQVFFARMFGFEPYTYFEAAEGADQAPKVDFN